MNEEKIPLTKYIASTGHCSRREAERLIRGNKVRVNNIIAELGKKVSGNEDVMIGDKLLKPQKRKIYIKLNKPKGYVCTNASFDGERSVFELIDINEKLFVVGRLDKGSRGLVLLTNDGDWANKIAHPRYGCEKEYVVRIKNQELRIKNKEVSVINKIKAGVMDEGDLLKAKKIESIGDGQFRVVLDYGKKRHIRRMFQALGLHVVDLRRVRIGEYNLGNLKEGQSKSL